MEVILAIAIIALIAVAFLPALSQGVNTIVVGKKFTVDSSATQKIVERDIADFYYLKYSDNDDLATEMTSRGFQEIKDLLVFEKEVKGYKKDYMVNPEINIDSTAGHGKLTIFLSGVKVPMPPIPKIGNPEIFPREIIATGTKNKDLLTLDNNDMLNFLLVGKEADSSTKKDVATVLYRWYTADVNQDGNINYSTRREIKRWDQVNVLQGFIKKDALKGGNIKKFEGIPSRFELSPIPNVGPKNNRYLGLNDLGKGTGNDYLRIADLNGNEGKLDGTKNNVFDFTSENLNKTLASNSSSDYEGTTENDSEFFRDYYNFGDWFKNEENPGKKKAILFSTTPYSDKGVQGMEKFAEYQLKEKGLKLYAWFDEAEYDDGSKEKPDIVDNKYYYRGVPKKLPMNYRIELDGAETKNKYYIYIRWVGKYKDRDTIQNEILEWDVEKGTIKVKNQITNGDIDFTDGIRELKATIYLLNNKPDLDLPLDDIEDLCILRKDSEADPVVIRALFGDSAHIAGGRFTTDIGRRLGDVWDLDHGDYYYPYSTKQFGENLYYEPILKNRYGEDFTSTKFIEETHKFYYTNDFNDDIDTTRTPDGVVKRGERQTEKYKSTAEMSKNKIDVIKTIKDPADYNYIKVVSKYEVYSPDSPDAENGWVKLEHVSTISFDKARKIHRIKVEYEHIKRKNYPKGIYTYYMTGEGTYWVFFKNEERINEQNRINKKVEIEKEKEWLIVKDIERNPVNSNNNDLQQSIFDKNTEIAGHFLVHYGRWEKRKDWFIIKNKTEDFREYIVDPNSYIIDIFPGDRANSFRLTAKYQQSNTKLLRRKVPGRFLFTEGFKKLEINDSYESKLLVSKNNYPVFAEGTKHNFDYTVNPSRLPVKQQPIAARSPLALKRPGEMNVEPYREFDFIVERIDWRESEAIK